MSNYPNEFRRSFAIRMPNGMLYGLMPIPEPVDDYSQSSAMRDVEQMTRMMMGLGSPSRPKPKTPGPEVFDSRKAAEAKLAEIQKAAAAVGVDAWGGTVVESLSTPFTSGDPSIDFADAILAWMREGQS